jgi:hypothetical protein
VRPHLALVEQAFLVAVHELDRILDRDDVAGPVPVDVVDQGGERGRLPRAGRPGDEDEPLGELAELQDVLGEAELLGHRDLRGDLAEDAAHPHPVHEQVAPEARSAGDLVGEIGVVPRLELFPLDPRGDGEEQLADLRLRHRGGLPQRNHVAVPAEEGGGPGAQVQVGAPLPHHPREQLLHRLGPPRPHWSRSGRRLRGSSRFRLGGIGWRGTARFIVHDGRKERAGVPRVAT